MAVLTHWEGEPTSVLERLWGVPFLEVHDRIGSTNDRVRELAREGVRPFTVVIAEEQVAGRGRGGRRWHSPPGSGLWMSMLLPGSPGGLHVPLLVGLAVSRAIESVCEGLEPAIEWPNDVVLGGRKVGGVLCEAAPPAGVVAGVGLNVWRCAGALPPELSGRATSLEEAGCRLASRRGLAGALLTAARALCARPAMGLGAAEAAELHARDALRDRRVHTEIAGEGTARGIDADGALLLEREDGSRVPVVAGSVRPA